MLEFADRNARLHTQRRLCVLSARLHVFDESGEALQPGHHVDILLRVHDLDLLPQLWDDGSSPPTVLQGQVLKGGDDRLDTSYDILKHCTESMSN